MTKRRVTSTIFSTNGFFFEEILTVGAGIRGISGGAEEGEFGGGKGKDRCGTKRVRRRGRKRPTAFARSEGADLGQKCESARRRKMASNEKKRLRWAPASLFWLG